MNDVQSLTDGDRQCIKIGLW